MLAKGTAAVVRGLLPAVRRLDGGQSPVGVRPAEAQAELCVATVCVAPLAAALACWALRTEAGPAGQGQPGLSWAAEVAGDRVLSHSPGPVVGGKVLPVVPPQLLVQEGFSVC